MSSGTNSHQSRKRPIDSSGDTGGSGGGVSCLRGSNRSNTNDGNSHRAATQAREFKRRQIMQQSWGFREVLAECGLLEFAASNASSASLAAADDNGNDNNDDDGDIIIHGYENGATAISSSSELGCQLVPNVSSSTLRSSINALLLEMSKNGIDPNNKRVLKDMEDMIVIGGSSDNNTVRGYSGGGGTSSLFRRMLLPLHRIRNYSASRGQQENDSYYDFSQFSQPDVIDGNNDGTTNTSKKIIVESSSLIKVLLRVDALQPTLLTALIQKLPELATPPPDQDDANNHCKEMEEDDLPRLIFSNMRWLDHIVDYSSLTNAFVECLTILASLSSSCAKTRDILLDAIATLPDVLNDSSGFYCGSGSDEIESSNPILSALQLLRVEDPTLLIPVLDAIGSLPLTEDQMHHVMRDALEALSNVEGSGLPALTTFVMNHCPKGTTDMAREVIDEMRKLPLGSNNGNGAMAGDEDELEDSIGRDMISSRSNSSSAVSQSAASSCLTIESLSRGFAHRPDLTLTLIKSIKDTPMGGYHPPADIWLLACCASTPHNRPKVKSIFKSKAIAGMFTSRLLRESLSGNGLALTSLFGTSLCDLADGLLRSSSSSTSLSDIAAAAGGRAACELGVTLYEILFEEFPEPMHRQEIVGCLVTHVGSGVNINPSEVNAALRVFCGIIDKSADGAMALRPYTPFLTSMLDHLHHMTPYQVRRLFLILFAVGNDNDDNDVEGAAGTTVRGGACDDIQICIRKHLSLAPFAMQRIGIIGTVAFAVSRSSLLADRRAGADLLGGSAAVASSPIIQEIKDMISNAYTYCKPAGISIPMDGNSHNTASRLHTSATLASSPVFGGSSMAFFLDELCQAVRGGRLAPPVKEWIDETIKTDFEAWFVGDFDDSAFSGKNDTEVNKDAPMIGVPKCSADLALLDRSSMNSAAPTGEIRFHVACVESDVYVKILSLLASHERTYFLPVQLSPMFRLMSTLNDQRYGGVGLHEIDAVLDCPLLTSSQASSGIEFEDLSRSKQWVVTSSCYFATSWIRQLINSFIHEANESTTVADLMAGSHMSSTLSPLMNHLDVQKRIIARLATLVELEEELLYTCSKCYDFAPPGLDILTLPKLLLNDNGDLDNVENEGSINISKENKKALTMAKKRASQVKKAKQKHEEMLIHRVFGALGQLDPHVCVALGFEDLSVMGSTDAQSSSQGLSQIQQVTTCGGPVTMLLLNLLQKVLSEKLCIKKSNGNNDFISEDVDCDNPYATTNPSRNETNNFADIAMSSCDESSKTCFELLDRFLRGGVFASLYEHLAAVAELRCGPNRKIDETDLECQLINTARCLFSCVQSVMGSDMLTRSATGRMLLASILKQMAQGDRNEYTSNTKRHRSSTSTMKTLMGFINDNVNEIIVGVFTGDLVFAMDGVNCMKTIFECSQRLSESNEGKGDNCVDADSSLSEKLFTASDKLLRQNWPDETKMNKGNVGVLLSLFVEHSPNRIKTLSHLVDDVLQEVRVLGKDEVVPTFPTCSNQTVGYFHSTVLQFLWKEIENIFHAPLGKTKDPTAATSVLHNLQQMATLLKSLSDLSNEYSTKKFLLLQHLKFGSKFLESFVLKAIPFFQVHFREHQESILDIIRCIQTWSRGLYHIISHGKRKKDSMLFKEAPRAKKALEMFIHKVKAMLKKNSCMTAMWTKTLKSRGVDGKVLREVEDSEEGEDDDCPPSQLGDETDGSESDSFD